MNYLYFDASSALKLFIKEVHSEDLENWILARSEDRQVTSHLGWTEVLRGLSASTLNEDDFAFTRARHWLDRAAHISLPKELYEAAGEMTRGNSLRSLDAIHVAAAATLESSLLYFVTYDKRQASAARAQGMAVAMPGIEID